MDRANVGRPVQDRAFVKQHVDRWDSSFGRKAGQHRVASHRTGEAAGKF
jgi:hypothetical protein